MYVSRYKVRTNNNRIKINSAPNYKIKNIIMTKERYRL